MNFENFLILKIKECDSKMFKINAGIDFYSSFKIKKIKAKKEAYQEVLEYLLNNKKG